MADGDNSTLYVLYGSATGNAEGIAKDLTAELNEKKEARLPAPFQKAVCWELNQFKKCLKGWAVAPPKGQKHGVLLLSSTTGNGDPPENAGRFTRFIKKQNKDASQPKPFEHVAFSVLALGDTNYDQFCATGVLIDKMVGNLGGTRAKPLVCADEGTGLLEETVDPWMESVVREVAKACLAPTRGEEEKVETSAETAEAAAAESAAPSAQASTPPPEKSPTPLYIMYGSATGNAEAIAKDLAATYEMILNNPDSKTYFSEVFCGELNQFKKMKLAEDVWSQPPCPGNDSVKHGLLVVASTTGNGDPPENSDKFLRYLKKQARAASKDPSVRPFQHVAFSVLGLGDTNYDQYCQHAKLLNKYMLELGGTEIRKLTCADEGTGQLETVVDGWTGTILNDVTEACKGAAPVVEAPKPVRKEKKSLYQEEEKKVEAFEEELCQSTKSNSPGVLLVQSLLGSDAKLGQVDASTLPKPGVASARVELVSEEYEALEKDVEDDDVSEDGMKYTLEQPFASRLVKARYLTATSTAGADEICESEGSERDILERRFPLQIENDVQEAARNGKRVIELTLSLPEDQSWEYQPGDSLGLVVSNTSETVEFVLNMLSSNHGISSTQKVSIDAGAPLSVEDIVRDKIDLCTVVKSRKILFALSQIASEPHERAVLELLASKTDKGTELFETFVTAQRRSIVDLLQEFPSCQTVTLQNLVNLLPPIPPRYYSVSSSPLGKQGDALTIAFSVVDYLTPSLVSEGKEVGLRRIHGVATSYLEALSSPLLSSQTEEAKWGVKIFPKPSEEFHLPDDASVPLILVGPGTGIAPFVGFLDHRKALAVPSAGSVEVFFGCRHETHDYLYRDELEALSVDGAIDHLHTAFSRDGAEKEYVQDLMKNNQETAERLTETIVNKNGRVYVCGDGNHMGRDVQAAIAELVGKDYVERMKRDGRFLLDIWS